MLITLDNLRQTLQAVKNKLDGITSRVSTVESSVNTMSSNMVNSVNGQTGAVTGISTASEVDALETRIDNIVAPSGDPSLTEVSDARVGADGTVYSTLKGRIDGEVSELNERLDDVQEDLNDSKLGADGLVYENTGSAVRANDNLNRESLTKNTYNVINTSYRPKKYTADGISWELNDDYSVTVKGTATQDTFYSFFYPDLTLPEWVEYGETYAVEYSSENVLLQVLSYVNEQTVYSYEGITNGIFTFPYGITNIWVRLTVLANKTVDETVRPIIWKGISNSELQKKIENVYQEAITSKTNVALGAYIHCREAAGNALLQKAIIKLNNPTNSCTLIRYGKNLLRNTGTSITKDGITFTKNNDGSVSAMGTAIDTTTYSITFSIGKSGNYYFNGCPDGGSEETYDVYIWDTTTSTRPKQWNGVTTSYGCYNAHQLRRIKLYKEHSYLFVMRIRGGISVNNIVFEPMICHSNIVNYEFEPNTRKIYQINFTNETTGTIDLMKGLVIDSNVEIEPQKITTTEGDCTFFTDDGVLEIEYCLSKKFENDYLYKMLSAVAKSYLIPSMLGMLTYGVHHAFFYSENESIQLNQINCSGFAAAVIAGMPFDQSRMLDQNSINHYYTAGYGFSFYQESLIQANVYGNEEEKTHLGDMTALTPLELEKTQIYRETWLQAQGLQRWGMLYTLMRDGEPDWSRLRTGDLIYYGSSEPPEGVENPEERILNGYYIRHCDIVLFADGKSIILMSAGSSPIVYKYPRFDSGESYAIAAKIPLFGTVSNPVINFVNA